MKLCLAFFLFSSIFGSSQVHASATKSITLDVNVEELFFIKPKEGVGSGGKVLVKDTNIQIDDIVLNLGGNEEGLLAEIFYRPTFLGLNTSFGNVGVNFLEGNPASLVDAILLQKAQVILDPLQVNVAGNLVHAKVPNLEFKAELFRVYCQPPMGIMNMGEEGFIAPNPVETCLNFMTFNGSVNGVNKLARVQATYAEPVKKSEVVLSTDVESVELRPASIKLALQKLSLDLNKEFQINSNSFKVSCFKDPSMVELKTDKLIKDCVQTFRLNDVTFNITDKKSTGKYTAQIKTAKNENEMLSAQIPLFSLSNKTSNSSLKNVSFECKFGKDLNFLEIFPILDSCIGYSKIQIGSLSTSEFDGLLKGLKVGHTSLNLENGLFNFWAAVRYLTFDSKINVKGTVHTNAAKKQIILKVVDTRLPLGISSVKFLMYVLRKNVVAKEISYSGNQIIITLN